MVFKSKSIYGWKGGAHVKADAQEAGELCERLSETTGLSAQTLLDASRKEGTVLHDEFEWDDGAAAEQYRLEQSRCILRSLVIISRTDEEPEEEPDRKIPVRAFFPISEVKGNYESVCVVAKNDDYRKKLLETCLSELKAFQVKYSALKDFVASLDEPIRLLQMRIEEEIKNNDKTKQEIKEQPA